MSHPVLSDAPSLPPKLRFLVVDDFETIRQVTAHQLRGLGAESVFLAKDGIQALAVLRKQPADVVISDWSMPHMDGLALLAALRGDPEHANLPSILVTGEPDRSLAERAVSLGVSGVLLKP